MCSLFVKHCNRKAVTTCGLYFPVIHCLRLHALHCSTFVTRRSLCQILAGSCQRTFRRRFSMHTCGCLRKRCQKQSLMVSSTTRSPTLKAAGYALRFTSASGASGSSLMPQATHIKVKHKSQKYFKTKMMSQATECFCRASSGCTTVVSLPPGKRQSRKPSGHERCRALVTAMQSRIRVQSLMPI